MTKTLTIQKLFAFPLANFDTYTDLEVEEVQPTGHAVREFRYISPDGTFLDLANYFTDVRVIFFENGEYNIVFSGAATNTAVIFNGTVIFWNALYALFGADDEGNTQMRFEDYYPRLRSGGELFFHRTWCDWKVLFNVNEGVVNLHLRSQAIKPILDKELSLTDLLYFPDDPNDKPDTQSSGCLSMIAIFVFLGSLLFL